MAVYRWKGGSGSFNRTAGWFYDPGAPPDYLATVPPGAGDVVWVQRAGSFLDGGRVTSVAVNNDATFSGTFTISGGMSFGDVYNGSSPTSTVTIQGAFRNTGSLVVGNYMPGTMLVGAGASAIIDGTQSGSTESATRPHRQFLEPSERS